MLLPCGQDVWALSRRWWLNDLQSPFFKGSLVRYICKADPSQPWHKSLKTLPTWHVHYIKAECGPLKSSLTASPISLERGQMWTRYMHCPIQHSRKSRKQVKQGEGDKVEDHVGALPRSVPPNLPHPQACSVAPSARASWFQQFGKIWRCWEKKTSSLGSFAQWNSIHKKYLSWTLTWKAGRGGGRSKKPLGLHFDNLKICQAFRLSSYPNTHMQDEVWK